LDFGVAIANDRENVGKNELAERDCAIEVPFGKRDLQGVARRPPFLNHALSMSGSRGRRIAIRFYTARAAVHSLGTALE
jgi:hypothetical protein